MLKLWTPHQTYIDFVSDAVCSMDPATLKRFKAFSSTWNKLSYFDLDRVEPIMRPLYSSTGRPALHQPEILRSLFLMMDQHCLSISDWVVKLNNDNLLALLIGCDPSDLPPLGSYYDLINRLWLFDDSSRFSRSCILSTDKNKSLAKRLKLKKGEKLPPKHPNSVSHLVKRVVVKEDLPFNYEKILQTIFKLAIVDLSVEKGLIPRENNTMAGDGTCVHTHSSVYGRKVTLNDGTVKAHYSDPDAEIGWDSDTNSYYYGYSLYTFAVHNSKLHIDLPVHFRFTSAKRHDSINLVASLPEFVNLKHSFHVKNLCLDSAHDTYPIYDLLEHYNMEPFIDLNPKGIPKSIPDTINVNSEGIPLCNAGYEMTRAGYCKDRCRIKWRCPLKTGKQTTCNCMDICSPSPYGRVVYTKPSWDKRLYPSVARESAGWKAVYKCRTSCERINNRILNDYRLHEMRIHGKKRYSFLTMLICANIHLDALNKVLTAA